MYPAGIILAAAFGLGVIHPLLGTVAALGLWYLLRDA